MPSRVLPNAQPLMSIFDHIAVEPEYGDEDAIRSNADDGRHRARQCDVKAFHLPLGMIPEHIALAQDAVE